MKILVTGGGGFVGRKLIPSLNLGGHTLTALVRRIPEPEFEATISTRQIGSIDATSDWSPYLQGQDCVIHLANCAHGIVDNPSEVEAQMRKVNVEGTLGLVKQCVESGVKRFIYLSSIKVNGEQTTQRPFLYDDSAHPEDAYARSKLEAEQGIKQLCRESAMEYVIVRPPLVYGPGVKANLAKLVTAIDHGWPIPLPRTDNRRDLISLDNLIDLIAKCATKPQAANQTLLCCDGHTLSTAELITAVAAARGRKARIVRLPGVLLSGLFHLAGKADSYRRLAQDLRVDMRHTCDLLDWHPPCAVSESMTRAFSQHPAGSDAG